MGAYFQNVFELNTAEHKLLRFTISHLEAEELWIDEGVMLLESKKTHHK